MPDDNANPPPEIVVELPVVVFIDGDGGNGIFFVLIDVFVDVFFVTVLVVFGDCPC